MYEGLSNIYKQRMKLPAQIKRMTGTLNGQAITGKNIIKNSAKIVRQCSDNNDVQIGQVYVGQLNITLKNISGIVPWKELKGKEIVLYEGLYIDRENEKEESYWDDILLGHFFIDDAPSTVEGFECVAYDAMSKFDKSMDLGSNTSGTLYYFINLACTRCNVELGMTQAQITSMPNGNELLEIHPDNDMDEYRDLISWCAQTMGTNAIINRQGKLVFKSYNNLNSVVETFVAKDRIGSSGKCSSFETFYTGISMVNIEEMTTSYYNISPDDGLTMNLGSNPLLQLTEGETEEQLEVKRRRILNALTNIEYTPFSNIRLHRPGVYDLMDVIKLSGGIIGEGVEIYGCITKYEWSLLGGLKIQGAGTNPALASAKSKTDKNISGLRSSNKNLRDELFDENDGVITNIQTEIEQQVVDISGKQNLIGFDVTPPSDSGENGDVVIVDSSVTPGAGNGIRIFHKENNTWTEHSLISYGTVDLEAGVSNLPTGQIYFVYEE